MSTPSPSAFPSTSKFNVQPSNPAHQASTDYWYGASATDNIWDGQWGLLRAFTSDTPLPGLKPLGGEVGPQAPVAPNISACPVPGTPAFRSVRRFEVTAVLARDVLLHSRDGQPIPRQSAGSSTTSAPGSVTRTPSSSY